MLCADATGSGTMTSVLTELESRVTVNQKEDDNDYKSYMTVGRANKQFRKVYTLKTECFELSTAIELGVVAI